MSLHCNPGLSNKMENCSVLFKCSRKPWKCDSWRAQDQDPETEDAKWNWDIINCIIYAFDFPVVKTSREKKASYYIMCSGFSAYQRPNQPEQIKTPVWVWRTLQAGALRRHFFFFFIDKTNEFLKSNQPIKNTWMYISVFLCQLEWLLTPTVSGLKLKSKLFFSVLVAKYERRQIQVLWP